MFTRVIFTLSIVFVNLRQPWSRSRLLCIPCRHVVIETNKTTARLFPEVPDCETPEFWDHMEKLIVLNKKLIAIGASDAPGWLKVLQKVSALGWAK